MEQKKSKLQGWYILEMLSTLDKCGDAYIDSEQLYQLCRRDMQRLTYERFLADKAFLLQKRYLRQEGRRIYLKRNLSYENTAADAVANVLADNRLPGVVLPGFLTAGDIKLTGEQTEAVAMALCHRLSIIMGGAGSGKTTLIKTLVQNRPKHMPSCLLCAPTGKAACNLKARTGYAARTVHSALHTGRSEDGEFQMDVEWPRTGLVVVDEASMMTTGMLAGILTAVCDGCRVVLIGDPNQLLSVGAGNVLQDLLALGVPHVTLNASHRQNQSAEGLLHNVHNFGNCHRIEDLKFDESFQLIPELGELEIQNRLCELAAERYLREKSIQLMSPYNHSGPLSVSKLNQKLQDAVNPVTEANIFPEFPDFALRRKDRVMVIKNDWDQNVCNGDIGVFYGTVVEDALQIGVHCDDRIAAWNAEYNVERLVLAYAITVHKSQGSEYDTVILPLNRRFSSLLHRNLFYTAISRARKKVILVGDPDALSIALQRLPPPRRSMLVQKVRMLTHRVA